MGLVLSYNLFYILSASQTLVWATEPVVLLFLFIQHVRAVTSTETI